MKAFVTKGDINYAIFIYIILLIYVIDFIIINDKVTYLRYFKFVLKISC